MRLVGRHHESFSVWQEEGHYSDVVIRVLMGVHEVLSWDPVGHSFGGWVIEQSSFWTVIFHGSLIVICFGYDLGTEKHVAFAVKSEAVKPEEAVHEA